MKKPNDYPPTAAILLSIVPGLAVWLFGKRRHAAWIWMSFALATIFLFFFPSLITWYLFCIIYLGQMVYSAGLAVWQNPDSGAKQTHLNANLAVSLPERFQQAAKLDQPVYDMLAKEILPDRDLVTAVLGLDGASSQYKYYGVTADDLVIADCNPRGDIRNCVRIPKDDVAWVSLVIGERNCLMTIRYEEDRYPSTTLHIPGKLKDQATLFVKEFPGTWDADKSAMDIIHSIHKLDWNPRILIFSLVSFSFIIFGFIQIMDKTDLSLIGLVSFAFGFFLLPWPYIIWLLREFKKEPALTWANSMRLFFLLPAVLIAWRMSTFPLGKAIVKLLQLIRHTQ